MWPMGNYQPENTRKNLAKDANAKIILCSSLPPVFPIPKLKQSSQQTTQARVAGYLVPLAIRASIQQRKTEKSLCESSASPREAHN